MRRRHLSRRQKWPLHLGLFLLYILIQLASSANLSSTVSSPPMKTATAAAAAAAAMTTPDIATSKPTITSTIQKKVEATTQVPKAGEQMKDNQKSSVNGSTGAKVNNVTVRHLEKKKTNILIN